MSDHKNYPSQKITENIETFFKNQPAVILKKRAPLLTTLYWLLIYMVDKSPPTKVWITSSNLLFPHLRDFSDEQTLKPIANKHDIYAEKRVDRRSI